VSGGLPGVCVQASAGVRSVVVVVLVVVVVVSFD
jgi:hypothetical protein